MSNPFQEHAQNFADYLTMLQGDDLSGGAVMTISGTQVPCTTSQLITNFDYVPGGRSSKTYIENVEFLAADVPANYIPIKGNFFTLKMNPQGLPIALMFWHGGLQQGGLVYRFMAVSQNWSA